MAPPNGGCPIRYFLAIVLPPVAVLLCGRPMQFVLNIFLTICGVIPGMIHALMVVSSHKADKRADRIIRAIKQSSAPTIVVPGRGQQLAGQRAQAALRSTFWLNNAGDRSRRESASGWAHTGSAVMAGR